MPEPDLDPPVRSVAEEAALLIGLLSAGLSDSEARAAGARASARSQGGACEACGHDPHAEGTSARDISVCRVCPVCQLIAVVKAVSPEVIERLADAVDMIGDGLRVLAQSRRDGPGPARRGGWAAAAGFPGFGATSGPPASDAPHAASTNGHRPGAGSRAPEPADPADPLEPEVPAELGDAADLADPLEPEVPAELGDAADLAEPERPHTPPEPDLSVPERPEPAS